MTGQCHNTYKNTLSFYSLAPLNNQNIYYQIRFRLHLHKVNSVPCRMLRPASNALFRRPVKHTHQTWQDIQQSLPCNVHIFLERHSCHIHGRELVTVCLLWQHWSKALVWFDDIDISAFHSCVFDYLLQFLSEWHLLLSACVLVCRSENVEA
jgi:hypothetical protein